MKTRKIILINTLFIAIAFLIVFACTKDKTPAPVEPCDPNKIYFQNTILPIISSNCAKSGCHDAITKEEGLNLTSYNGVMKIVKAGSPSGSELMSVINTTKTKDLMPPLPNSPLTQEQKNLISRWISEGALNIQCSQDTTSCSTATVSYTKDVSKIITANCIGCHSGGTLSGGIDLSTHAGVKSAAASGKLYNSISQNGSAAAMPPTQKLSPCDIKSIKIWVDAGGLNN